MRQHCEVCAAVRPEAAAVPEEKLVYLEFAARTVRLCMGHARIAQNSGVRSFEELRELYGTGRRSHVPRRGQETFEGSDEKRRRTGRRATDARG
jgi:hypothetical protein